jgi:hypothetical protein
MVGGDVNGNAHEIVVSGHESLSELSSIYNRAQIRARVAGYVVHDLSDIDRRRGF